MINYEFNVTALNSHIKLVISQSKVSVVYVK